MYNTINHSIINCCVSCLKLINKKFLYYLYLNHKRKVYKYEIELLNTNLVFKIEKGKHYVANRIYIKIDNISFIIKNIYYNPIIKIFDENNIFNLYYIYIIRMFSVKKWKNYSVNYDINMVNFYPWVKKFYTMRQYKCIIFI